MRLRHSRLARTLTFVFLLCAVSFSGYGQVLYGSITGTVSDPSGGAVPGATVQVQNPDTGLQRETTTNGEGIYLLSDLPPGNYTVTITSAAFAKAVVNGASVAANQVRRVDATLQVAQVSQTVEVNAASQALQTDRADVNTNISRQEVANLPITGSGGRNFQSLLTIVPGTTLGAPANSAAADPGRSFTVNVNGVSRLQNNTRIDGSSITYPWLPANIVYVPPAEAIETVNVVTNSFNAEQGLAGGSEVNVTIKSGTNDFHGSGWIFNTDSHFFAQNFFHPTPQNNKYILNQFGLTFGGPVWIPKVFNGKNKLFFFVDWERTTIRTGSPPKFLTIPTADLRAGDFSATGTTIYDPASNPNPALRTAFPGNRIPTNRIDPAAATMASLLPAVNVGGAGSVNNYVPTGKGTTDRDNIDIKINHHVTDKLAYFGRYSYGPSTIFDPPQLGAAGGDALNGGQLGNATAKIRIGGAGLTYTISPTLLLDANAGYTRQRLGAEDVDIGTNYGLDVLHIPGTNGSNPLQGGIPFFAINGYANLGNSNTGSPFLFRDNQYVSNVNLSWVKGPHTLRFGFEFQDQQLNHFQAQGGTFQTVRGSFQFNGQAAALQNGPSANMFNAWAAFLLGLPSNAGKVMQRVNPNSLRMFAYAGYAQDQWQVNPKLTLNYGVRYEFYPWPHTDHGGVPRFDPSTGQVYIGGVGIVPENTGADAGSGQFVPRFGIAYRVTESTVIRSGFGLSVDPKPYIDFRNAYPNINAWAMPVPSNAFIPVTTLRLGLDEATYGQFPNLGNGVIPLPANTGTTTWPKDVRRKYIESWNFMVQHQFGPNTTAQAGYVGTRAVGQMQFVNINPGPPATPGLPVGNAARLLAGPLGLLADINEIEPFKTTTYDAMQSQITHRFGTSQIGAVYTWSKTINWADNDANPRIQWPGAWNLNRGPAGYDHTHNVETFYTLESPFGAGKRWMHSGIASHILSGWSLTGIFSALSGAPIYVIQSAANNLNAAGSAQVPDLVKTNVAIYGGIGLGHPYFDTTAFAPVNIPANQPQRFGTSGRDNIRGPGFLNMDTGLFRTFTIRERFNIQFRAEALNILNHPNFATPTTTSPAADVTSGPASFGFITSTATNANPREFRFATRVFF
ncbi:MAG: TonB-dependent receptor [Acidobacteriaceae bacterium]|nr:TonB-dependent receptor [Acidobacteriaceae bacterium]